MRVISTLWAAPCAALVSSTAAQRTLLLPCSRSSWLRSRGGTIRHIMKTVLARHNQYITLAKPVLQACRQFAARLPESR